MQARKKIEVIIGQMYVPRILELITKSRIGGYTLIKNVIGSGDHGEQDAQELIDVNTNSYFIIITTHAKAELLMQDVKDLMEKTGGMLLVSDIQLVA